MENLFTVGETQTFKLVKHDHKKGILYYEGGWWMTQSVASELEFDREMRRNYNKNYNYDMVYAPRPNKETKEIELDKFSLPNSDNRPRPLKK